MGSIEKQLLDIPAQDSAVPQKALVKPYVVADIGGTNARFGLVTGVAGQQSSAGAAGYVIESQKTFPSSECAGIEEAYNRYIESVDLSGYGGLKSLGGACLAVAGPVAGNDIKLTNLNWQFKIDEVKASLGLDKLSIINDFAAYAYAIQYISESHLSIINPGEAIEDNPIAVVGPGTGFGVAALVRQNRQTNVMSTEAGHMSLAANTPLQAAIKEQLTRKYSLVSVERVFSGPGLRHLYHAYAAVEGTVPRNYRTAEISQHALDGTDEMCQRTLSLFCSWLGSVTGDLALALGARGGIFLGGGILPRIADFLIKSDFQKSFKAKDQMSHYLENIPVKLVTEGNSALFGAAAWFQQFQQERN